MRNKQPASRGLRECEADFGLTTSKYAPRRLLWATGLIPAMKAEFEYYDVRASSGRPKAAGRLDVSFRDPYVDPNPD